MKRSPHQRFTHYNCFYCWVFKQHNKYIVNKLLHFLKDSFYTRSVAWKLAFSGEYGRCPDCELWANNGSIENDISFCCNWVRTTRDFDKCSSWIDRVESHKSACGQMCDVIIGHATRCFTSLQRVQRNAGTNDCQNQNVLHVHNVGYTYVQLEREIYWDILPSVHTFWMYVHVRTYERAYTFSSAKNS